MPEDIPGGDMSACMEIMQEDGHDEDSAARICEALSQEAESESGNVEQLKDALEAGRGLIADVGVDLVSGVDTPAVDSKWVMMKSGGGRRGHDFRANTKLVLRKDADTEQRISYAAAMIPREPDKEGDVVATPTVESAAHNFIKADGGIDTDHSLIDGEGDPVESWVLKEERTFDLPAGGSETYPAGTWMLGIEWGADAWERIKQGELSGLSIYGNAEKVALAKSTAEKDDEDPCWEGYTMVGTDENGDPRCVPDDEVPDAEGFENAKVMDGSGPPDDDTGGTPKSASGDSASEQTPMSDADPDGAGGDDGGGPTLDSVAASVESLSETVADLEAKLDGDPDGGGDPTDKAQDYWDVIEPAAEDIAALDDIDMSTSEIEDLLGAALEGELGKVVSTAKAINADTVVEMLASMEDIEAGADRISEQVEPLFEQTGEDPPEIENESDGDGMDDDSDDDEDDDEEMGKSVTPGFDKGHGDGADTAATAKDADGADGGLPSFRDVAEEKHGGL
jgi:hypothetical protein